MEPSTDDSDDKPDCPDCGRPLGPRYNPRLYCGACGRSHSQKDGIFVGETPTDQLLDARLESERFPCQNHPLLGERHEWSR